MDINFQFNGVGAIPPPVPGGFTINFLPGGGFAINVPAGTAYSMTMIPVVDGGNGVGGGNGGDGGNGAQGGNVGGGVNVGDGGVGGNIGDGGNGAEGGNVGDGGNGAQGGNVGDGGNGAQGGNVGGGVNVGDGGVGGNVGGDGNGAEGGNVGDGGVGGNVGDGGVGGNVADGGFGLNDGGDIDLNFNIAMLTAQIEQRVAHERLSCSEVLHLLLHDNTLEVREIMAHQPHNALLLCDNDLLHRRDFHTYGNSHRYDRQIVQLPDGEQTIVYRSSVAVHPDDNPLLAIATRRYSIVGVDRFLLHYRVVDAQGAHIQEDPPRIPLLPVVPVGPPFV